MQCPAAEAANLVSIARDICPFPDYTPNPFFNTILSVNSSSHLRDYFAAVQAPLTPQQLDTFTKSLRTTFGREGKVSLGGVGVVALSLAVLFDTLARQAKGQWMPESAIIPGLFHQEQGRHNPMLPVISEYLRIVPYIANNPTRMREVTEKYYRRLHYSNLDRDREEKFTDIEAVNAIMAGWFIDHLRLHLIRISGLPEVESLEKSVYLSKFGVVEGGAGAARRRRQARLRYHYTLNCDAEVASTEFLAEVDRSNKTKREFENCKREDKQIGHTVLHDIAVYALQMVIKQTRFLRQPNEEEMVAQREDFDLKANTRGNWGI